MGKTISEKILSRINGSSVTAKDIIYPEPELVTIHDWYVLNFDKALSEVGVDKLFDPEKVLICTDHEPIAISQISILRQKKVREIIKKYNISKFFDVGRGGHGHIFPIELGYVRPGMFIEAYDVHVSNFGAVGALAIPLVVEISEVLACGSVWISVPETIRINLEGSLSLGTSIRDVAQKIIFDLGAEIADYSVIEYGGPALKNIDIAGRHTLCNTPIDIGAKSALVEPDTQTLNYLKPRTTEKIELISSDDNAKFKKIIDYNINLVEPQIAIPPTPDTVVGVSEIKGQIINHAFVGSCASANLADLRAASNIIQNKKIHPRVRLFITPGTSEIMLAAQNEGIISKLVEAGAVITQPGCGPCAGGKIGGLGDGEVSINTGTRNDYGRLGGTNNKIFLGSPETVAASAIEGKIADPREFI